jgi:hypothetical protein
MAAETIVKERPILFSGEMVKAILAGRKTQTRRAVRPQPEPFKARGNTYWAGKLLDGTLQDVENDGLRRFLSTCPYGAFGDRLWVKESLVARTCAYGRKVAYAADDLFCMKNRIEFETRGGGYRVEAPEWEWKRDRLNAMYMPRWASRLTLEITGVRVERVQEITPDDVWAEGLPRGIYRHAIKGFHECDDGDEALTPDGRAFPAVAAFGATWDAINCVRSGGAYGWDANPWVFVISFKKL